VSCCAPKGYSELFGERAARRDAKRYRRKGLDETAEEMVEFLRGRGLGGTTVLEIGGGVGAIPLELLKAGADRALEIELSPNYERTAAELARELGFADRVERRLGDVVEEGATVPAADAVVMHRVV
jgi:predicted O-methyltransferase YrrM